MLYDCRLVNDVAMEVLGHSTSPEHALYKSMADVWTQINTDVVELLPGNKSPYEELINFGEGYLEHSRDRGDYRELASLSLLLLGAFPAARGAYSVRSIGAVSNARWMSVLLCELKLVMFRSQFIALGIVSLQDMKRHMLLTQFLLKYYIQQWLQSPGATAAAVNDLVLFKRLLCVTSKSPLHAFAKAMHAKLDKHLWYLSEENVVLIIFGCRITADEQARCAKVMVKYHRQALQASTLGT